MNLGSPDQLGVVIDDGLSTTPPPPPAIVALSATNTVFRGVALAPR